MPRTSSPEGLETTDEVAHRLGVSCQTVRDWTRAGLPVRKLSAKLWRYSPSQVDKWLVGRAGLTGQRGRR